jgi:prolyl oligopeptidase
MLGRKQSSFDDFLAAGEWLVREGHAASGRLAILGGSNGGLLVGAALTQRPGLFRAAVAQAPLLDMLRYHEFRIARLWIPEYWRPGFRRPRRRAGRCSSGSRRARATARASRSPR